MEAIGTAWTDRATRRSMYLVYYPISHKRVSDVVVVVKNGKITDVAESNGLRLTKTVKQYASWLVMLAGATLV